MLCMVGERRIAGYMTIAGRSIIRTSGSHGSRLDLGYERTVPISFVFRPEASASYPTMRAISCTSVCTSRELVPTERSSESLAFRHGCVETWALLGKVDMIVIWGSHTQSASESAI